MSEVLEIPLTRGLVALVDVEDADMLSGVYWHAAMVGKTAEGERWYYARRNAEIAGKRGFVYMHRQILNAPDGVPVDHVNGNRLDNRRANLRLVTASENQHNRRKHAQNNTSRYKGVHWTTSRKRWTAVIRANNRVIHLGYYMTEEHAAAAYDRAAVELHGEFACINKVPQPASPT